MNERDNRLKAAWVGKPVMLAGRELKITVGRYALLEYFGNQLATSRNLSELTYAQALGEFVMVAHADRDRLAEIRAMTFQERRDEITDFLIEHDGEIERVANELGETLNNVEAAAVEIDDMGKQAGEALHRAS